MNPFRIFELPPKLWLDGKPSIQLLCARNKRTTSHGKLYVGKSISFLGKPLESYQLLTAFSRFAWHGQLNTDYVDATLCIDLTVGFNITLDGPDVVLPETTDFDLINGANLLFVDDEIMFIANPKLIGKAQYHLQVMRGRFGTPIQTHAAGSDAYIIRGKDFEPFCCDYWFAGNTGKFKLTLGVQQASDHDPIEHAFSAAFLPPISIDLTTGQPTIQPGPPAHANAHIGETWRDAYLAEWRCVKPGTPGAWIQTHPAMSLSENSAAPFPIFYQALTADGLKHYDGKQWLPCG